MREIKWILVIAIILTAIVVTNKIGDHEKPVTIHDTMSQVGMVMEDLFPFMFGDAPEQGPAAIKDLDKKLEKLSLLFDGAEPHFSLRSPTYRVSFDVIKQHITQIQISLHYKNLAYARNMLKELTSICASCHTQDTQGRTLFSGTTRERFANDAQFAEFNYITRDYADALRYYEAFLEKNTDISETELLTAVKRILTIYTQIYNQPGEAAKELGKYTSHKSLNDFSKKTLKDWIEGLNEMQAQGYSKVTQPDFKTIEMYANKMFGPLDDPATAVFPTKKEAVSRVWLRGLLYHYLNTSPPTDEVPKILYWLAIIDRSINYSFYYSLADLYLKQCIVAYPNHPYAEKCYNEYRDYVIFSYSGSSGTNIPQDVLDELDALGKKLNNIKIY